MKLLPLAVSLPSLLVLLIFIQSSHSTPILDPINIDTDFIKAAKEIISFVRSDIDELDKETGNFETAKIRENQLKVIQHLNNVTIQVRQINDQLTPSEERSYLDFNTRFHIKEDLSNLLLSFGYLDLFYKLSDSTPQYFDNFVESISGLTIDRFPFDPNSTNVFYQIIHGFECKQHDYECKKIIKRFNEFRNRSEIPDNLNYEQQQSPQQLYYSLYKEIALGELMAYILIEYSLMIKKVSANGNFITKRNAVRHNYDEITKNALNSLKHVTEKADRALWRRDPDERVYNETFAVVELNEENGDRYFNLRETLSDVKANKVVTGIRFVNKNHIFHLQIQRGELLPRGLINKSTVEWIPIDNYEIGNSNVKEGVDYHKKPRYRSG
ncbi:uncharacterized protein LOC127565400 [Drosophila albomicans]|uniref:Uncharacterized protein LOC127565400 n=1 Tax=Drosophila albomicans TaxID=7291 RepID=A0A9C6T3P0_DROAB|nr:uncharacterized protein LOC127565400 [Drosophila albomicans]